MNKVIKNITKQKGLSLAEMLVALLIIAVLSVATMKVFTQNKSGRFEPNSVACVKSLLASSVNLASNNTTDYFNETRYNAMSANDYCKKSIDFCRYGKNQACETLGYYANHGKTTPTNQRVAARKVLRAVCDLGGENACDYFVKSCAKDKTVCNILNDEYDLHFYLATLNNVPNPALSATQNITSPFYGFKYPNVFAEVNNTCCNPDYNMACKVGGMLGCNWGVRLGGVNDDCGYAITLDASGNIYIIGYEFSDIAGGADIFVIKLNSSGTVQWKKKYGGTNDDYGNAITIDASGNIYIVGEEWSDSPYGLGEIFVVKLNNSGEVQWQKKYGGNNLDYGRGIALDTNGDIYITGSEFSEPYGGLEADAYVLKIKSFDGTVYWKKKLGGTQYEYASGIKLDYYGNIYITGNEYSNAIGSADIFVIKLDSSGTVLWKKKFGGGNFDAANGISLDSSNNIYITGDENSDQIGANEIFVIKLNSANGTVLWKKKFGGIANDKGYGIGIDSYNNSYITGYEKSDTAGNEDIFAIKLDPVGTVIWKKKFGGISDDEAYGIAIDSLGNSYIVGDGYSDTAGNADIVVIKLMTKQLISNLDDGTSWHFNGTDLNVASNATYFNGTDLDSTFNTTDIIEPNFNGTNLIITTSDLNVSFNSVPLNKTIFFGL